MPLKLTKNILFLAGLGALTYGCWLVYHPAGFIVAGLLIFWISLLLDRTQK